MKAAQVSHTPCRTVRRKIPATLCDPKALIVIGLSELKEVAISSAGRMAAGPFNRILQDTFGPFGFSAGAIRDPGKIQISGRPMQVGTCRKPAGRASCAEPRAQRVPSNPRSNSSSSPLRVPGAFLTDRDSLSVQRLLDIEQVLYKH